MFLFCPKAHRICVWPNLPGVHLCVRLRFSLLRPISPQTTWRQQPWSSFFRHLPQDTFWSPRTVARGKLIGWRESDRSTNHAMERTYHDPKKKGLLRLESRRCFWQQVASWLRRFDVQSRGEAFLFLKVFCLRQAEEEEEGKKTIKRPLVVTLGSWSDLIILRLTLESSVKQGHLSYRP